MEIDDDVKITINLNKLVDVRARLLTQYENYATKIVEGEYLDENDIDMIASKLRDTLTWDSLFSMVDESILEYLDKPDPNKPHYGEIAGDEPAKTFEQQRKNAAQFEMVKLTSYSWEIEVPRRKNK